MVVMCNNSEEACYVRPEVVVIKCNPESVLMQSGSTTEPIDDGGDIN